MDPASGVLALGVARTRGAWTSVDVRAADGSTLTRLSLATPETPTWHDTWSKDLERLQQVKHPRLERILGSDLKDATPTVLVAPRQGASLYRALLARAAPLEEALALLIIKLIAEGVDVLHRAGHQHGRIDCAAIRMLGQQQVQLANIGPWLPGTRPTQLPWSGFVAPELGPNDAPTREADIFSLGTVLLASQLPVFVVDGPDAAALHAHRVAGWGPLFEQALSQSSQALRDVIRCACHPNPEERYDTVADFAQDCTAALAGQRALRAQTRGQEAPQATANRSNFFSTNDIEKHLQEHTKRISAGEVVVDQAMLAAVAKLVVTSKDQLIANINLAPGTAFPRHLLELVLAKAGITHGVIDAALVQASSPAQQLRRLVIARGTPPRPGKPGCTVYGRETIPLLANAQVEISDTGMEAWIHTVAGEHVERSLLEQILREAGVKVPTLPGILDRLSTGDGDPSGKNLVARGEEPIHARQGRFLPSDREVLDGDEAAAVFARLHDDGDLPSDRAVKTGSILAVWRQGTHHKDGFDVRGNTVPARQTEQLSAVACAGEGVELHRNKKNVVFLRAKRDGMLQFLDDATVRVVNITDLWPDQLQPGASFHAEAMLVVHGDIPDGVTIIADAGLVVEGSLGDASVEVGGDCFVEGSVLPGVHGLRLAGRLEAKSITNRTVMAGDMAIEGAINNCTLTSLGAIRAQSICGGQAIAAGVIEAQVIGAQDGSATEIWAGHSVPAAIQREVAVLRERQLRGERQHMLDERNELRQLVEEMNRNQYRFQVGGFMGKDYLTQLKDRVARIKLRSMALEETLESTRQMIVTQVDAVEESRHKTDNTRAWVRAGKALPGAVLRLASAESRKIMQETSDIDHRMH